MGKLKRTLLIVLAIFVFIFGYCGCSETKGKKYAVESIDYNVNLLKNGDANITETWTVYHQDSSNFCFTINIDNPANPSERWTDVTVNEVKRNSDPCENDTYQIKKNSDQCTIKWDSPRNKDAIVYTVSYTLANVVKKTDSGKAIFNHRYKVESLDKEFDNYHVIVHLPEKGMCSMLNGSMNYSEVPIDHFEYSGSLKPESICDSFPSSMFSEDLSYIDFFDLRKELHPQKTQDNSINGWIYKFIFLVAGLFIIMIVICQLDKKWVKGIYR